MLLDLLALAAVPALLMGTIWLPGIFASWFSEIMTSTEVKRNVAEAVANKDEERFQKLWRRHRSQHDHLYDVGHKIGFVLMLGVDLALIAVIRYTYFN